MSAIALAPVAVFKLDDAVLMHCSMFCCAIEGETSQMTSKIMLCL